MKQFFKEFKAFISKGNALDLAIGLVLGTAVNNIVNSLVNDMIMPLFSLFGGRSMSAWFFVLRGTKTYNESLGTYVFSESQHLNVEQSWRIISRTQHKLTLRIK